MLQSAVSKISLRSAGLLPAETVLRGTIYDRQFNELAVSYRLYTLEVHPAELDNHQKTIEALAQIIGVESALIAQKLKDPQYTFDLADDLDENQAEQIKDLHMAGVYCKPKAVRFYPEHTAASHVLGFMGDGVGLAGVEGKYDTVLQAGEFRKSSIPDIDFSGHESLGESSTDLILTLDIGLQRQLESSFREYLASQGAEKGMGLLLEPATGCILALVNQPSFNPNYFWKANESTRINRIYNHVLDRELIRPVLAKAAAIQREGLGGNKILPVTVAAPDYGFNREQLNTFAQEIKLDGAVSGNWEPQTSEKKKSLPASSITGVQVGVTLASLVNGGWRITPYVVDSIFDHGTDSRYQRDNEATQRLHVLDPALGVIVRRELFSDWQNKDDDMVVLTSQNQRIMPKGAYSRYSRQELFVGLTPVMRPKYLLVMAVEKDHLDPAAPGRSDDETASLQLAGKRLLARCVRNDGEESIALDKPPEKNSENLHRFFINKRLDYHEVKGKKQPLVVAMPQVRGMSLRKGLQLLDELKLKVRINGSGRIIAQYPLPGQPLSGINECILTLDSR